MRLTKGILTFIVLCFTAGLVHAQNLSDIDFKSIRVDQLTDQQIQRIYDGAKARNLSIDQTVQMATAQGLPQSQASKLKRRLQQVQSGNLSGAEGDSGVSGQLRSQTATQGPPADSTKFDSLKRTKRQLEDKIFGYNLFNKTQISFEPALNIPTPKDYQLGP